MTKIHRKATDPSLNHAAQYASTSEDSFASQPARNAGSPANAAAERERLMAEFSIAFNGRRYEFDRYRYDRLADAVAYARLQRSRPGGEGEVGPRALSDQVELPNELQRELMAELGITIENGVYRLGLFRYDRLADAARYARHLRRSALAA